MEVDASTEASSEVDELSLSEKITILPGASDDLSAATYCLMEEDHTLGNLLRWMIMQNPDVDFCGYSAPHPSEDKIHLRIQMHDHKSSLEALRSALDQLETLTISVTEAYHSSLQNDTYERREDEKYDFETVNNKLWREKEANGHHETQEQFEERKKAEEERAKQERIDNSKAKMGKKVKR